MIKNLTTPQIFGIILIALGAVGTSTAQLDVLFGVQATKIIVSACTFGSTVIGAVLAFVTGQGAQVQSVLNMPGVEGIKVNKEANQTLAAMAVDPTQPNIGAASPAIREVLKDTARA